MTVGSRIREFRKRLGLSVDDVAEKLGKNRATIYRYESDDIENLPAPILSPLAKVLQTTPAELMGWEQSPSSTSAAQGGEHTPISAQMCTPDEIAHLTKYRALDENGRELVDGLLDTLYTQRYRKSTELSEETSAS